LLLIVVVLFDAIDELPPLITCLSQSYPLIRRNELSAHVASLKSIDKSDVLENAPFTL
jgi:hypothetical protein